MGSGDDAPARCAGCAAGHGFDQDIADALKWKKAAPELVGAMVQAGFLDENANGTKTIHNWQKGRGKRPPKEVAGGNVDTGSAGIKASS